MKTVPVALRVWAEREKSGDVTIKVAGPFISTIRDTPGASDTINLCTTI